MQITFYGWINFVVWVKVNKLRRHYGMSPSIFLSWQIIVGEEEVTRAKYDQSICYKAALWSATFGAGRTFLICVRGIHFLHWSQGSWMLRLNLQMLFVIPVEWCSSYNASAFSKRLWISRRHVGRRSMRGESLPPVPPVPSAATLTVTSPTGLWVETVPKVCSARWAYALTLVRALIRAGTSKALCATRRYHHLKWKFKIYRVQVCPLHAHVGPLFTPQIHPRAYGERRGAVTRRKLLLTVIWTMWGTGWQIIYSTLIFFLFVPTFGSLLFLTAA